MHSQIRQIVGGGEMGFEKQFPLTLTGKRDDCRIKQTKNKLMVFNCAIALATLTWHIQYKCVTNTIHNRPTSEYAKI